MAATLVGVKKNLHKVLRAQKGSKKRIWRQFSGYRRIRKKCEKILQKFRQKSLDNPQLIKRYIPANGTFLPSHPKKKKRESRQKITQKNCALFRGPKTQKKCSIFTLKNYALLTEFHPPLEFPLSLTRQTIPKMGLHRGKTLPYRTIMYRTTSVSLFAAQLNCRRSWVILETDPQFLPLSFHRFLRFFFTKKSQENASYFFGVFLFFFVDFFLVQGRRVVAVDSDFLWQIAEKNQSRNQ